MSEQILNLIYDFTKNYTDPSSKMALDENNKNLSIVIKNGNINLTLTIDSKQKNNYDELVRILKTNIAKIIKVDTAPVLPSSKVVTNALGISATIPAKIISDIPLPIPL